MSVRASELQPVVVDLPNYRIYFSLPNQVTMPAWKAPNLVFDTKNPSFQRDGFRSVAEAYCDFNGPFWVGTRGSLILRIMVNRPEDGHADKVTSLDGLEIYLKWWTKSYGDFEFDRQNINGVSWIRRSNSTFLRPTANAKEEVEIYSLPLDQDMFVSVRFEIKEWIQNSAPKWKKNAIGLRNVIKSSIKVEKKPNHTAEPASPSRGGSS